MGQSGFAAAKFLAARDARVRATDCSEKKEVLENAEYLRSLGVEVETGRHTPACVAGSDFLVTSPGVARTSLPLVVARRLGIPVISEVELAYSFCRGRIIAVTGSNGKTTTCHLLHRLLTDCKKKSVLCGNVGRSFLDTLPEITPRTNVVLELSSFQLEDTVRFRPGIAVVLNVSPNHLDRHGRLEDYIRAKEKIFRNQRKIDFLILNQDDKIVRRMARKARSKTVFHSRRLFTAAGLRAPLLIDHLGLPGDHNLENILACVCVARILGLPFTQLQRTLDSFRTLEHRLEPVGSVRGVRFINDSKSTTIDSTRAALRSVSGPLILIAGGRDKGAPFREIGPLLRQKVRLAVLYGEAREKIARALKSFARLKKVPDFRKAVRAAFREAVEGDSLLLSPMCASFDQFSSFEARGEAFKKVFAELKIECD